jgi:hypothetical protein
MNFFEYENSIFGDVWNEKTIKELQEHEPPEGTGTPIDSEPDPYYCWQGTRIPQWFE